MTEERRITVLGEVARSTGGRIVFLVRNDQVEIDTYIFKIQNRFPDVKVTRECRVNDAFLLMAKREVIC